MKNKKNSHETKNTTSISIQCSILQSEPIHKEKFKLQSSILNVNFQDESSENEEKKNAIHLSGSIESVYYGFQSSNKIETPNSNRAVGWEHPELDFY